MLAYFLLVLTAWYHLAGWVKASEEATNIDTSSTKGYYGVKVLQAALIAAGIVVSAAESIGLKQPADISF